MLHGNRGGSVRIYIGPSLLSTAVVWEMVKMEPILLDVISFILPFVLIAMGEVFRNTTLQFFGGTAAIFAGLRFVNPVWLMLIFAAVGIYYVSTAIWTEMKK